MSGRAPFEASLGCSIAMLLVACSRAGAPSQGAVPSEHEGANPSAVASSTPSARLAGFTGRAQYKLLGVLNPLLQPYREVLGDHFGGEGETPFAVQKVDIPEGRMALLVSRLDGADPMLLMIDHDQLAWSKPYATVGILPPVGQLALAPSGDRGAALFTYGTSTHGISARIWAEDGGGQQDIDLASFDACSSLSVTYGPPLGWIAVCGSALGAHAQRLGSDRRPAWGEHGVAVGEPNAVGPATIVLDTAATWVLVQRAKRGDVDHLVAFRYDAQAKPIWTAPVDIGVPGDRYRGLRLEATATSGGAVRIELPGGLAGKRATAAVVAPDGGARIL